MLPEDAKAKEREDEKERDDEAINELSIIILYFSPTLSVSRGQWVGWCGETRILWKCLSDASQDVMTNAVETSSAAFLKPHKEKKPHNVH